MIKKSARFKVIIDLQASQEQDALVALGRSQQKLLELESQLQQLQSYQQEYQFNFAQQQQQGMNISQLLEFRAFADKLQTAIEGQQLAVSNQEQELLNARKHWEQNHHRTKSLEKISNQALAEEIKIENKYQQQEQDSRATRSSRKDGTANAK